MKTIAFLIATTISLSASATYPLTPYELLFKFPGEEKLEVFTKGGKFQKIVVTIGDTIMKVTQAELMDLPSVFVDSIRYELEPSTQRREVSFEAGERGNPFSNPPIPAKIIHVTLCFDDGAYTSRMTEVPTGASTSEVRIKKVGMPETTRATVKKQSPMPVQENAPKSE